MPSKPMFSDAEKEAIWQKLQILCSQHWSEKGFKRTSIKELCDQAQISIGTFYALYPSKEHLFCETAISINRKLKHEFLTTIEGNTTFGGMAFALKQFFRNITQIPFLSETNSPDVAAFMRKLSIEQQATLVAEGQAVIRTAIRSCGLVLAVEESVAFGVLAALQSTVCAKYSIDAGSDYFEVIDFMIDCIVPRIFRNERK